MIFVAPRRKWLDASLGQADGTGIARSDATVRCWAQDPLAAVLKELVNFGDQDADQAEGRPELF